MNFKKFFSYFLTFLFLFTTLNINYLVNAKPTSSVYNSNIANEKIIYLTFDDGPSKNVSPKILDILKTKNVKATFFVIGYKIKGNEDVLKRMYNEGHSIGLHTYTHKRSIYRTEENFINEMDKASNEVYNVLHIHPRIIRFPWGSSGQLNKGFLEKLHCNGYRIFDWNVCITDGLNPKTPSYKLYKQAINNKNLNNIILLMHCDDINKNTCKALPNIIDYYKKEGYVFKVIKNDTPELYFRLKK